jgi:hypothetical protein
VRPNLLNYFGCIAGLMGLIAWYLVRQYRIVGRFVKADGFHYLEGETVPAALSKQAQALLDQGFHYFAAYRLGIPDTIEPAPRYLFDNEDSTIKAMVIQRGLRKGIILMTLYADGMQLATLYNMPFIPYYRTGRDDSYYVVESQGAFSP